MAWPLRTICSFRRPRFGSQYPHSGHNHQQWQFQEFSIPWPLRSTGMHMVWIHLYRQNTQTHTIFYIIIFILNFYVFKKCIFKFLLVFNTHLKLYTYISVYMYVSMTEYILCPIHAHTEGSLFSFWSDSQAFTCAIPLSSSVWTGQQQSAKETMSLDFYRNSGIYGVCSSEGFSLQRPISF